MHLVHRMRQGLLRRLLSIPIQGRHVEYSAIASADDDASRPTPGLIALALRAIQGASTLSLHAIQARTRSPIDFLNLWPGEHYRLLASLVQVLQPHLVVEIGTGSGGSALVLKQTLPPDGTLVTFDIIPWQSAPEGILQKADFADGRLVQHVEDVSQPEVMARHRAVFEDADLIYLDAAKDGRLEQAILDAFERLSFRNRMLLVCDDIRVWNMMRVWRQVRHPKLDLTSFGHWTGTGLIEWPSNRHRDTVGVR